MRQTTKSFRNEGSSVNTIDTVFIKDLVFKSKDENPLRYPTHKFKLGKFNLIGEKVVRENHTYRFNNWIASEKCRETLIFKNGKVIKLEQITFAYCSNPYNFR